MYDSFHVSVDTEKKKKIIIICCCFNARVCAIGDNFVSTRHLYSVQNYDSKYLRTWLETNKTEFFHSSLFQLPFLKTSLENELFVIFFFLILQAHVLIIYLKPRKSSSQEHCSCYFSLQCLRKK